MGRESFLLYKSFYEPIKSLSLEDKGALLEAIYEYQVSGAEPPNTSPVYMVFLFFKNQFRLDDIKYDETCAANKNNINKRWNKKNTTVYERIPSNTNHTDKENGNDKEKENVKEKEKDKGNDLHSPSSFSFNQFWELYNKKTGLTKCEELWQELTEADKALIKERLPTYIKATESEITFRKDPYTWLMGKHWLDEHIPAGKKSAFDLII